jgi:hypothetical protein
MMRGALERLLPLYRNTDFAFSVAGAMAMLALGLILIALVRHWLVASDFARKLYELKGAGGFESRGDATGADPAERQFASRYSEIDAAMQTPGRFGDGIARAWKRYRRTLSFVDAPPVRATQPPSAYLLDAFRPPTWLGFAANLFIAFGLLATFLGLIAALTFATQGMMSAEAAVTQAALRDLLASAASKFITSVAGVGLSMLLRLAERLITISLRGHVERLSDTLEAGIRVDPDAHGAAMAATLGRLLALQQTGHAAHPTDADPVRS